MLTVRLGDGQRDFSPVTQIELTPADELRIADFFGDGTITIAAADHAKGTLTFAVSSP